MRICPNDHCPHLLSVGSRAEYVKGTVCAECGTELVSNAADAPPAPHREGVSLIGIHVPVGMLVTVLALVVPPCVIGLGTNIWGAMQPSELIIVNDEQRTLRVHVENDEQVTTWEVPTRTEIRQELSSGALTVVARDERDLLVDEAETEVRTGATVVFNISQQASLCRIRDRYSEGSFTSSDETRFYTTLRQFDELDAAFSPRPARFEADTRHSVDRCRAEE